MYRGCSKYYTHTKIRYIPLMAAIRVSIRRLVDNRLTDKKLLFNLFIENVYRTQYRLKNLRLFVFSDLAVLISSHVNLSFKEIVWRTPGSATNSEL